MTPGEQAFEDFEADWEAEVLAHVERMEALGLVRVLRDEVGRRQRGLASAEYDLRQATERARRARIELESGVSLLEDSIRLASRSA